MKWSWKIGEYAGIGVYVHATFLLLLGWVGWIHWTEGRNVGATIAGVGFILAVFACVVLHEFGHALTAKRYGIATKDITLLPIGGVARLEKMPDEPSKELLVALAGPAVNVVIAAVLYVGISAAGAEPARWEQFSLTQGSFFDRLLLFNVIMVLFNMLPAFPMDGGRVLRAVLAMRMDYLTATQVAAGLGQAMAYLFGFIGLFANPFLLFIALFVWVGAQQEASLVTAKLALGGIPVSYCMVTKFRALKPQDTLAQATAEVLAGFQQDFPVVEDEKVVGVLTRSALMVGLAQSRLDMPVSEIMKREFQVVDAGEMLETAFMRLQSCECRTMPVLRNQRLVGVLTMDNVGEFLSIQMALSRRDRGVRGSVFDGPRLGGRPVLGPPQEREEWEASSAAQGPGV